MRERKRQRGERERKREGRGVSVEDKDIVTPSPQIPCSLIYNIVTTPWYPISSLPTCDTVVDSLTVQKYSPPHLTFLGVYVPPLSFGLSHETFWPKRD